MVVRHAVHLHRIVSGAGGAVAVGRDLYRRDDGGGVHGPVAECSVVGVDVRAVGGAEEIASGEVMSGEV